jgi:hypothetical protein
VGGFVLGQPSSLSFTNCAVKQTLAVIGHSFGGLLTQILKEGEEMDEKVAFARDIRPLFSNRDVSSMSRFFDLSSYDDVRAKAERIYRRLADGTMPCYGPWPADNVQRFRTWIDNGFAP